MCIVYNFSNYYKIICTVKAVLTFGILVLNYILVGFNSLVKTRESLKSSEGSKLYNYMVMK